MTIETIPDEAVIVRGERNRREYIQCGIETHPSVRTGISVECGVGLEVA